MNIILSIIKIYIFFHVLFFKSAAKVRLYRGFWKKCFKAKKISHWKPVTYNKKHKKTEKNLKMPI